VRAAKYETNIDVFASYLVADQDQVMVVVVGKEFLRVVHNIYKWHVVNKHMPQQIGLSGMYEKKNFKEKFNSVLNHPLTLVEFELHKDSTLDSMYHQR
jgi:hypothetical protein